MHVILSIYRYLYTLLPWFMLSVWCKYIDCWDCMLIIIIIHLHFALICFKYWWLFFVLESFAQFFLWLCCYYYLLISFLNRSQIHAVSLQICVKILSSLDRIAENNFLVVIRLYQCAIICRGAFQNRFHKFTNPIHTIKYKIY